MKKTISFAIRKIIVSLFIVSLFFFLNETIALADSSKKASEKILYSFDFTGQKNGSAVKWLKKKGFKFKLDAKDLNPRFEKDSLVISTDRDIAGIFGIEFPKEEYIYKAKRIRIVWGVNKYPIGADWSSGNNRVPIAIMFSFGTETIDSGLFVVKGVPYFLSPFIGMKEKEGQMYLGKLFKKGGRYFCVASGNRAGETIVTDFEVDERFRKSFNKKETPPITAFSFQMNTKDTEGGAKAFLRKVEFLSD